MRVQLTMQHKRPRLRPWILTALVLGSAAPATADDVTGTWTGDVSVRGNYYLEDSTRVVAPEAQVRLAAPQGTEITGQYLVDVITSASQAAGALQDERFTEVRHDVTVGLAHELDLGPRQLELSGSFRVSKEPDWLATGVVLGTRLFLADRATELRTAVRYLHDAIEQQFRGGVGVIPMGPGGTSNMAFNETANAIALNVGWQQVVTPTLIADVSYDFANQAGYLANPYRSVLFLGVPSPESHPTKRRRHTVAGRLAWYIPKSRTSLQALFRAYFDSWDIVAANPEVRIYQEAGQSWQFRARYRFYQQTAAFFYEADPNDYTSQDTFFTADPKMSPFVSHELGGQVLIFGEFLRGRRLDWLADGTLELTFDYRWSDNAFGDAIIAMLGFTVPF